MQRELFTYLLVFALISMLGCATTGGYGQFYQPKILAILPITENVSVYQYTEESLQQLLSEGYFVIGISSFNGPLQNQNCAIEQAKRVGARIALLDYKSTGTQQSVFPLMQYNPSQTTTFQSHSFATGSAFGTGGYAFGSAIGHSTGYITTPAYTTYQFIPITVERYDHFAIYLGKMITAQKHQEKSALVPDVQSKIQKNNDLKAIEWFEKSRQSLNAKEWAEVIRCASAAISLDPGLIGPYINRAWAYAEKGFYDEAVQDGNTAIEINPNIAFAYNSRGYAYLKKGDIEKAKEDYEKACKLNYKEACNYFKEISGHSIAGVPEKVNQFIDESNESLKKGDWDAVINSTTEALRLNPSSEIAYTNRAGAYVNKGMYKEALEDCNKAIKINPNYSLAYNTRGQTYLLMGKKKEAALDFEISCNLGTEIGCKNLKTISSEK